jgi:putative hydrolase of the HAD superfamily
MRHEFWVRYGTTLNGLMRHHGIHPRRFLAETHVFPELGDLVVHENALKHALGAPGRHEARVLERPPALRRGRAARHGARTVFRRGLFHRGCALPRQARAARVRMLLRKHNLDPHRCAFVDDMLENLRTARRLECPPSG